MKMSYILLRDNGASQQNFLKSNYFENQLPDLKKKLQHTSRTNATGRNIRKSSRGAWKFSRKYLAQY